eukprot:350942-Chlamydomonas_euryale.AAC.1
MHAQGRARRVDARAAGGWRCVAVVTGEVEGRGFRVEGLGCQGGIRCGRSLLPSLLRFQHLRAYSCRRIPSHVPPTNLSGALWPPEVLAQPLGVDGSQDPWWMSCYKPGCGANQGCSGSLHSELAVQHGF